MSDAVLDSMPCKYILMKDTRPGWKDALRVVVMAESYGAAIKVGLSKIRVSGEPIKDLGFTAGDLEVFTHMYKNYFEENEVEEYEETVVVKKYRKVSKWL